MRNWSEPQGWMEEEKTKCPSCGGDNVTTRVQEESFIYGPEENAVELKAQVPVHSCKDCELDFTDGFGESLRHAAICEHLKVMTPDEVASVRKMYGVSRSEFARVTRLGEASLGRWENGNLIQNAAYDSLLFLLTYSENFSRLKQRGVDHRENGHVLSAAKPEIFRELAQEGMLERKRRDSERFVLRRVS